MDQSQIWKGRIKDFFDQNQLKIKSSWGPKKIFLGQICLEAVSKKAISSKKPNKDEIFDKKNFKSDLLKPRCTTTARKMAFLRSFLESFQLL